MIPQPLTFGLQHIIFFQNGLFTSQDFLNEALIRLELLFNATWLILACAFTFEIKENQCLHVSAIVLEKARCSEDHAQHYDQQWSNDVVVAAKEWCFEHGTIKLNERSVKLGAGIRTRLMIDIRHHHLSTYDHVIKAYDIDNLGAQSSYTGHLYAISLFLT